MEYQQTKRYRQTKKPKDYKITNYALKFLELELVDKLTEKLYGLSKSRVIGLAIRELAEKHGLIEGE